MRYQRRDLIKAYLSVRRGDHLHPDFETDDKMFYEALQKTFGIRIDPDHINNDKALWFVFSSTAGVYTSLRTTRQGFLDDSLVNTTIERIGELGRTIQIGEARIGRQVAELKDYCLKLLEVLLDHLWPGDVIECSSDDLLRFGYDDSKRPQMENYRDKL